MFSEQIAPLVRLRNKIWTMSEWCETENMHTGRGLAPRPLSARRVHVKMTLHIAQCKPTQYVILRRPRCVPILNLNEGVPRTFHSARSLNARVTRTCFENILPGSCTENIYERAHSKLAHSQCEGQCVVKNDTEQEIDLYYLSWKQAELACWKLSWAATYKSNCM